jgi:MFS family permease
MTTVNDSVATPARDGLASAQWLALWSGFLGWLFDSMDLNLFSLVLFPSVAELIHSRNPAEVAQIGAYIMAIKLFCWGLGGVVFGIGGEWAAGAALIAETWPEKSRARAMQVMQMAFAFGFFLAAIDNLLLGPISWRWVLAAGALPAVIGLGIRWFVPEPERWLRLRNDPSVKRMTSIRTFAGIFSPDLRRHTLVGVLVSAAMMIGSWGGLTLLPSWIQQLVHASGGTPLVGVKTISYAFMLMMVGAVLGYGSLIFLTDGIGRRGSYFLFGLGSLLSSLYLFVMIRTLDELMWFMPVYGYFIIGGFGTFAAYLPELFPTRVRATGQGFCWNAARCLTAIGPLIGGMLVGTLGSFPAAAASTAIFYAVGLIAIWFGPETRGVPLRD